MLANNNNKVLDIDSVHYAFSILDLAANMMHPVREVRKIEKRCQIPSDIMKNYFPSSMKDVETQRFNIARILPSSISNDEVLAMWFLESDQINRTNLFYYLSEKVMSNSELEIKGLSLLAQIICKLDVASGFVDGLKFFVPTVGCWDPLYNDSLKENGISPYVLKKILYFYVNAHLHHSAQRIIPQQDDENINILIEALTDLAYWLLHFLGTVDKTTHNNRQDFYSNVSTIVSPIFAHAYELTDRSKELSKFVYALYESVKVGRPLEPLPAPIHCPSYLFPRFGYNCGALLEQKVLVSVGFTSSSNTLAHAPYIHTYTPPSSSSQSHRNPLFDDDSTASPMWAYLTHDAIYFFSTESVAHSTSTPPTVPAVPVYSSRPPVACLPLERCNVRQLLDTPVVADPFMGKAEDGRSMMGPIVQLSGTTGRCIPFMEFNGQAVPPANSGDDGGGGGGWAGWSACMPSHISYHESILLRVESSPGRGIVEDSSGDPEFEEEDGEQFHRWLDAIAATVQKSWQPSQLEHTLL